ncbi:MAG: helix-turn-helix domain-containing protein [Acidobacteria bacterium]|nr:helix-turn-helix domain-containing protein [Acidobacteriota bacterium]
MGRHDQPSKPEQLQLFGSRFLNIDEVGELLGVPRSFIYRRTARGHGDPIPHYRLGGHLRFKLADIEAWAEAHRKEPQVDPTAALVAALREKSRVRASSRRTSSRKPRLAT